MYANWTPMVDLMVLAIFSVILSIAWVWMMKRDVLPGVVVAEELFRSPILKVEGGADLDNSNPMYCIDCGAELAPGRDRCMPCTNHYEGTTTMEPINLPKKMPFFSPLTAAYSTSMLDELIDAALASLDEVDDSALDGEFYLGGIDRDDYDVYCEKHKVSYPIAGFCPPCEDEVFEKEAKPCWECGRKSMTLRAGMFCSDCAPSHDPML